MSRSGGPGGSQVGGAGGAGQYLLPVFLVLIRNASITGNLRMTGRKGFSGLASPPRRAPSLRCAVRGSANGSTLVRPQRVPETGPGEPDQCWEHHCA